MKYLLIALMFFGLGCAAKMPDGKPLVVSKPAPAVVSAPSLTTLDNRILEGRVKLQPILLVKPGTEAQAKARWQTFVESFPRPLAFIMLEPKVLELTGELVQKGEAFADSVNLVQLQSQLQPADDYTFPIVYWNDDTIGMNQLYDAKTGLFVRLTMNALNTNEVEWLQWLAAVHE